MTNDGVNSMRLKCSFGSETVRMPDSMICDNRLKATIMDNKPLINIPTFGTCSSLANPKLAAAAAAAMGVLNIAPCIPVTAAPWTPGDSTVLVSGVPALTKDSQLMCSWGGTISIVIDKGE